MEYRWKFIFQLDEELSENSTRRSTKYECWEFPHELVSDVIVSLNIYFTIGNGNVKIQGYFLQRKILHFFTYFNMFVL